MRGTRVSVHGVEWHTGIIPAHAGNTESSDNARKSLGDHPRACGEHVERAQFDGVLVGSSPRMRGTQTPHLYC